MKARSDRWGTAPEEADEEEEQEEQEEEESV